MKKVTNSLFSVALLGVVFGMSSCQKNETPLSSDQLAQNAINDVRNIVGGDGTIKLLESQTNLNNYQTESIGSKQVSTRKLTISEFKNVYNQVKSKKITYKFLSESRLDTNLLRASSRSVNGVTSMNMDNIEIINPIIGDDGGPGPAGYHHVQFSPSSPLNNDLGGSYTMHLIFNTDKNGQIIGTPTISYTGIGFYSWQQVNISAINFNAQSFTSNFTITGISTYGIQIGSIAMGWSDLENYQIKINMNGIVNNQVTVEEAQ